MKRRDEVVYVVEREKSCVIEKFVTLHQSCSNFIHYINIVNLSTITYITLHLIRAPRINSLPFEIKTHPSNLITVPQFCLLNINVVSMHIKPTLVVMYKVLVFECLTVARLRVY